MLSGVHVIGGLNTWITGNHLDDFNHQVCLNHKYAGVTEGSTTFASSKSGSKTTTYVKAQAFLYKDSVRDSEIAKQLVQTIIYTYPESLNKNLIKVTLTYGYDIGIASKWNSYNYKFNPQELKSSE